MKKVVIIGGGFAGATVARSLEQIYEVTLIDSKDYFEFTPGILRAIADPTHMKHIEVLHTHYLNKAQVVTGRVTRVTNCGVWIGRKQISFDYLIICSGSRYATPIKEQKLIITTRARQLRKYHALLSCAKRVLIIGGGPVGVELAAEIATHYQDKKITLVHASSRILGRMRPQSSKYAADFLECHGVNIVYHERVMKSRRGIFIADSGRRIFTDLAFLCTGIVPNSEFLYQSLHEVLTSEGYVRVNKYLQLNDYPNIFAAGDVNDCAVEKTAQNAEKQGAIVTYNIKALDKSGLLKSYNLQQTPLVVSLGKYRGILETTPLIITGIFPALLKWLIEKREMLKLRSI